MFTKKGSSLILVLLIISGVITVTVGAQRVVLVQFAQSNQASDNTFAYNAAKAGIEDGLARFRYNRNAQTAFSPTPLVYRYDLTAGVKAAGTADDGEIDPAINVDSPPDQVYDLSINYKTQQIGINTNGTPTFSDPTHIIAKDDFLQLSGFSQDPSAYYLRYVYNLVDPIAGTACTNPKAFVQMQVTYIDSFGKNTVGQVATQPGQYLYDSKLNIANLQVNPDTRLIKSIRIRPYYCSAQFAFTTSRAQTADGLGAGSDAGPKFDSLTTVILSTGYYGSAKRSLLATVNRQTGQLISIYDFTAYAGSGNVSP